MGVKITSNIIFLGTGSGSYVVGKNIRGSGGIILQVNEDQFHIDPGPGSLANAKEYGVNVRANTAVLVTHNHLNHCNDINAVIDAMTYSGFDKKGVLIANNTVINGSEHYVPFLHEHYKNFLERFIVLEAGKRVGINNVEIQALSTKHNEASALGYKFITPDYVLTYVGDTQYSVETASQYDDSDVLILNVPYLNKEEGKNNLCKEDAIKIIDRVKPKLAIITHFGVNFLKADPLYEIRDMQKQTDCQVIAAKDGMVVNPVSYAVEQGQKTLYKFSKSEGVRMNYQKEEENKVAEIDNMIKEEQKTLEEENKPE
ncbi:MBL fold metallo-hydrolase [Candidatus Woesearchaeota archaeon]|nr:MBL fold metallo-hydrolase [Candidatus Woesearchaeota archaeon]